MLMEVFPVCRVELLRIGRTFCKTKALLMLSRMRNGGLADINWMPTTTTSLHVGWYHMAGRPLCSTIPKLKSLLPWKITPNSWSNARDGLEATGGATLLVCSMKNIYGSKYLIICPILISRLFLLFCYAARLRINRIKCKCILHHSLALRQWKQTGCASWVPQGASLSFAWVVRNLPIYALSEFGIPYPLRRASASPGSHANILIPVANRGAHTLSIWPPCHLRPS